MCNILTLQTLFPGAASCGSLFLSQCLTRAGTTDVNLMEDWQQPYSFYILPTWCSGRRMLCSWRQVVVVAPVFLHDTWGAEANHLNASVMQLRTLKSTKASPCLCCRVSGVSLREQNILLYVHSSRGSRLSIPLRP